MKKLVEEFTTFFVNYLRSQGLLISSKEEIQVVKEKDTKPFEFSSKTHDIVQLNHHKDKGDVQEKVLKDAVIIEIIIKSIITQAAIEGKQQERMRENREKDYRIIKKDIEKFELQLDIKKSDIKKSNLKKADILRIQTQKTNMTAHQTLPITAF